MNISELSNEELSNAVENLKHWINEKESLAECFGKGSIYGMHWRSSATQYKIKLNKIHNEIRKRQG